MKPLQLFILIRFLRSAFICGRFIKIARKDVAQKIIDYLHHRITLAELVDWAENIMMEADFENKDFEALRDIVSRLGLADVKAFGISWKDCEYFLSRLGYQARVIITDSSTMASVEKQGNYRDKSNAGRFAQDL